MWGSLLVLGDIELPPNFFLFHLFSQQSGYHWVLTRVFFSGLAG